MCYKCYKTGHFSGQCPNPVVCDTCGQEGHMRKDCPNKGKAQSPAKGIEGGGKGFKGGYGAQSAGKGVREVHWSGQDQIAVCLGESARWYHRAPLASPLPL